MSEWIRIRVKDFYKDAVGELEYTYVIFFPMQNKACKTRIYRRRNGRSGGTDRGIGRGYGHPADGNRNPAESNAVTHPSAERAAAFLFF